MQPRAAVERPPARWPAYNNPGAYSYHHCAHVKITANDSMPLDEGWPAQHSATD